MPRIAQYKDCFDEVIQISISDLRRLGYLKQSGVKAGLIVWTDLGRQGGELTHRLDDSRELSIEIVVDLPNGIMQLDYKMHNRPIRCSFAIESVQSNLGTGLVYYFVCPNTKRLCRKLYLMGSVFRSRFACPSTLYSSQIITKSFHHLFALIEMIQANRRTREFVSKPYAKPFYKGKPTRRFKSLLDREKRARERTS